MTNIIIDKKRREKKRYYINLLHSYLCKQPILSSTTVLPINLQTRKRKMKANLVLLTYSEIPFFFN